MISLSLKRTKTLAMDSVQHTWPLWRKILFRFFFIYLGLNIAPWTWLDRIPYVEYVTKYYYQFLDWAINLSNAKIFHIRKVLVPINGSGDTSYGWAQVCLFIFSSSWLYGVEYNRSEREGPIHN